MASDKPIDFKDLLFTDHHKIWLDRQDTILRVRDQKTNTSSKNSYNSGQTGIISENSLFIVPCQTSRLAAKPFLVLSPQKNDVRVDASSLSNQVSLLTAQSFHQSAIPVCHNYGGFQNSCYVSLGDCRTISLGICNGNVIQIRGAGPTAISKDGGDGLITLSGAVYEYLMTEALAQLNIPTSKCLAVIASQFPAYRGESTDPYPTGIITRYAPTWLRFGTLEYFHLRGETVLLKAIMEGLIEDFYPECKQLENQELLYTTNLLAGNLFSNDEQNLDGGILASGVEQKQANFGKDVSIRLNRYGILFRRIVHRTAQLIASWQANGFVHGNLNTENFSLIGMTLNFSNCGFMDIYNPQWTSNANDPEKRYSFDAQPAMAIWALQRLSQSFVDFVGESFGSSAYDPNLNRPVPESQQKPKCSVPTNRVVPNGFLYNSNLSENVLREIISEFDTVFSQKLGELMLQVICLISLYIDVLIEIGLVWICGKGLCNNSEPTFRNAGYKRDRLYRFFQSH